MAASVQGYHGSNSSTGPFLPGSSRLTVKELQFFEEMLCGPFVDEGDSGFNVGGSIGSSGSQSTVESVDREIQKLERSAGEEAYPLDAALLLMKGALYKIGNARSLEQQEEHIAQLQFCLRGLASAAPAVQTVMGNVGTAASLDFLYQLSRCSSPLPKMPAIFSKPLEECGCGNRNQLMTSIGACYIALTQEFVTAHRAYKDIKTREIDSQRSIFLEQRQRLLEGSSFGTPSFHPSGHADREASAQSAVSEAMGSLERYVNSGQGEQGLSFADSCTRSYQQIAHHEGTHGVNLVYLKYTEVLTQHLRWHTDGRDDWGKRMFLAPATAIPGGPDVYYMARLRLVAMKWAMQMPASLP